MAVLLIYIVQLNTETNVMSVVLLIFSAVILLFNVLLIEVIGQIIRKKSILTNEICVWLGKVITITTTAVVTIATICTGNFHIASFFAVPIVISAFLADGLLKKVGGFSIIFCLVYFHSTLLTNKVFINNAVFYDPSSVIQAGNILCMVLLAGIIVNKSRQTSQKANILQSMATTDVLTGLINRRYFDRRIAEEVSRSKRHTSNLTLALFDIDHFKRINDTYGHTIGDKILKELGDLILANTRESDVSARYGGEEFALILPETTQVEASDLLERLRQLVESYTFNKDDTPVIVTISVGIAQYDHEYTIEEFIEQADAALYQAKRTGRNKVVYGTFTTPKLNLQKVNTYAECIKQR
jgi:diguanylate cyclase (GGDEF)-like protein